MTVTGVGPELPYFPAATAAYPAPTTAGDFLTSTGPAFGAVWGTTHWSLQRSPTDLHVLQLLRPDGAWFDNFMPFAAPKHKSANFNIGGVVSDTAWHDAAQFSFDFIEGHRYLINASASLNWTHDGSTVSCKTTIAGTDFHHSWFPGAAYVGSYTATFIFIPTAAQAGNKIAKIQYGADYAGADLGLTHSDISVVEQ